MIWQMVIKLSGGKTKGNNLENVDNGLKHAVDLM